MTARPPASALPAPAVIFENAHWLAVDKPSGVLAVPARFADGRPVLADLLAAAGKPVFAPVHRLDREVSGLMLFAKDPAAHRAANAWFETRVIHKTYEAWTEPSPAAWGSETLTWRAQLLRGKKRAYESPHGKESVTQARFLGRCATGPWHRWELSPLTGRAHQLRYEMHRHGEPIAGDRLYGATIAWAEGDDAIALRAVRVSLADIPAAARWGLPEELRCPGLEAIPRA